MGTGVNRRRSWALMQTIAGLRQPIRSSGDRMTDLSELCQIEVGGPGLYTPFQSVMGHGTPQKGGLWVTWLCSWGRPQRGWWLQTVCWSHFQKPGQRVLHWHRNWVAHHHVWNVEKVPQVMSGRAGLGQRLSDPRSFQSTIFLQRLSQRFKSVVECSALEGGFLLSRVLPANWHPPQAGGPLGHIYDCCLKEDDPVPV